MTNEPTDVATSEVEKAKLVQLYSDEKQTKIAYPIILREGVIDDDGNNAFDKIDNQLDEEINNARTEIENDFDPKLTDIKETIELNKTRNEITKRKIDTLMKLSKGITHEFTTDETKGYVKKVPSGGQLMTLKKLGGQSICWNQIATAVETRSEIYGITRTNISDYAVHIEGTSTVKTLYDLTKTFNMLPNHKYFMKINQNVSLLIGISKASIITSYEYGILSSTSSTTTAFGIIIPVGTNIDAVLIPQVFDLTVMFGKGKEPTADEFNNMLTTNYYEYNEGTLISFPVDEIETKGSNLITASDVVSETMVSNAITYQSVENYIYITGKATAVSYSISKSVELIDRLDLGKTYYLTFNMFENTSGESVSGLGIMYEEDGEKKYAQKVTITRKVTSVKVCVQSTVSFNGYKKIYPCLSESKTYIEYNEELFNTYKIQEELKKLDGYGLSVPNYSNEIDFENKTYTKNVSSYTFTGDEVWTSWINSNDNNKLLGVTLDKCILDNDQTTINKNNYICDTLKCENPAASSAGSISFRGNNDGLHRVYIPFPTSSITTEKDLMQWLKDNPTTVYYKLEEPVVTDISDILTDDFMNSITVEENGSIKFKSNTERFVPVPSTEEYLVKLTASTNE